VEKGGTRSGALENLSAGWVPLHARDDGSPGNARLISEGATALPIGEIDQLDIAQLTKRRQHSLLPTQQPDPEEERTEDSPSDGRTEAPPEAIDDAFVAIWPYLAQTLGEPIGEREVADALKLELKQARTWLKRAVSEGNAEEMQRPKRYVLPAKVAKQLRIETD
jgi:hypothetical protein